MPIYPGSDLTVSQLLSALNNKLDGNISGSSIRAGFNFDELSRLEEKAMRVVHVIRSFKNAYCPVNRIHPESLALVFQFAAENCHKTCFENPVGVWTKPYDWIAVSHVCRYWRTVSLEFPSLWTFIDSYCPAMATVALERSRFSQIAVHVRINCTEDFLSLLGPHVPRLYELTVMVASGSCLSTLAHFESQPAPLLRGLRIKTFISEDLVYPSLPILFQAHTPSLQTILISQLGIGKFVPQITNIVKLGISGIVDLPTTQLFDVLQSNPMLEILILSYIELTPEGNSQMIINLPFLQELHICDCDSQIILQHLSLPCDVHITILCVTFTREQPMISEVLPASLDYLPNLSNIDIMGLRVLDESSFSFDGIREADSGSITIGADADSINPYPPEFFDDVFRSNAMRSFRPIPVDHVRELWLDNIKILQAFETTNGILSDIFSSLPALTSLILIRSGTEAILKALTPTADRVPCKALTNLTISDCLELDGSTLLEFAIEKKAWGVPLKRLSVICFPGRAILGEEIPSLKKNIETFECKIDDEEPKWPFLTIDPYIKLTI